MQNKVIFVFLPLTEMMLFCGNSIRNKGTKPFWHQAKKTSFFFNDCFLDEPSQSILSSKKCLYFCHKLERAFGRLYWRVFLFFNGINFFLYGKKKINNPLS